MLESGMLREGSPIELIDGLLVGKDRSALGEDPMTIGEKHNLVVKLLARLDAELVAHGCHMQTQGPVNLSPHDAPEPDGLVVRGEPRDYTHRIPEAKDAMAVIEVADSSLEYDRSHKLALYARAGIAQYVIVNVRDGYNEVHETPSPEGRYASSAFVRAGASLPLRVGPDQRLDVEAERILP
jgi:Uma2 family endonuclease